MAHMRSGVRLSYGVQLNQCCRVQSKITSFKMTRQLRLHGRGCIKIAPSFPAMASFVLTMSPSDHVFDHIIPLCSIIELFYRLPYSSLLQTLLKMSSPPAAVKEMQYAQPETINQAQPSISGASALKSVSSSFASKSSSSTNTFDSRPRTRSQSAHSWE